MNDYCLNGAIKFIGIPGGWKNIGTIMMIMDDEREVIIPNYQCHECGKISEGWDECQYCDAGKGN